MSRVLGGAAERLDAGQNSPVVQETASNVYHIITGSGYSELNGKVIHWKQGDTFCIPSWYKYQHFASSGEAVYLYKFHDKPMLRALGFYRQTSTNEETLMANGR